MATATLDGAGPAVCTDSTTEGRRHLFIVADDFGYCSERDRGIIEGFASGGISAATLLVNGAHASHGAAAAVAVGLPLGLHFNLTEGTPVHVNPRSSLLDRHGQFRGKAGFFEAVDAELIRADDISRELVAQLERFRHLTDHGAQRLDGHNHVHVVPIVATTIAPILAARGVSTVRIPFELDGDELSPFLRRVAAFASSAVEMYQSAKVYPSTAGYLGLGLMGRKLTVQSIVTALAATDCPDGGVVELMTHPGHPAQPGVGGCGTNGEPDAFALSSDRQHELAVVCTEALHPALHRVGFSLWTPEQGWPQALPSSGCSPDTKRLFDSRPFLVLDSVGALVGDPASLVSVLVDQLQFELTKSSGTIVGATFMAISEACAVLVPVNSPAAKRLVCAVVHGALQATPLLIPTPTKAMSGTARVQPVCALHTSFVRAITSRYKDTWYCGLPFETRAALWRARPGLLLQLIEESVTAEDRPLHQIEHKFRDAEVVRCCNEFLEIGEGVTQALRDAFHRTAGEWRVVRVINCVTRLSAEAHARSGPRSTLFRHAPPLDSVVTAACVLVPTVDRVAAVGAVSQRSLQMLDAELDLLGIFLLENLVWIEGLVVLLIPPSDTASLKCETAATAVLHAAFSANGHLEADIGMIISLLRCPTPAALSTSIGSVSELAQLSSGHSLLLGLSVIAVLKHHPSFEDASEMESIKPLWVSLCCFPDAVSVAIDSLDRWATCDHQWRPVVLGAAIKSLQATVAVTIAPDDPLATRAKALDHPTSRKQGII